MKLQKVFKKDRNKTYQNKSRTFTDRVHEIVKNIKKGSVLTYMEVAKKAGNPNASRAVGSIMRKNYDPEIPCHRVIRTDGKIGQYNSGGPAKKLEISIKEGVDVSKLKIY